MERRGASFRTKGFNPGDFTESPCVNRRNINGGCEADPTESLLKTSASHGHGRDQRASAGPILKLNNAAQMKQQQDEEGEGGGRGTAQMKEGKPT